MGLRPRLLPEGYALLKALGCPPRAICTKTHSGVTNVKGDRAWRPGGCKPKNLSMFSTALRERGLPNQGPMLLLPHLEGLRS